MQAELEDLSFAILEPQAFDCLHCQLRSAWFPPTSSASAALPRESEATVSPPAATPILQEPASCTPAGHLESQAEAPVPPPISSPRLGASGELRNAEDLAQSGSQHHIGGYESMIVPCPGLSRQGSTLRCTGSGLSASSADVLPAHGQIGGSATVLATPWEHAVGAAGFRAGELRGVAQDASASSSIGGRLVSGAAVLPDLPFPESFPLNEGLTDTVPSSAAKSDAWVSSTACVVAPDNGDSSGSYSALDVPQARSTEACVMGRARASSASAAMPDPVPQSASSSPANPSSCGDAGFEPSSAGCSSCSTPLKQGVEAGMPREEKLGQLLPDPQGGPHVEDSGFAKVEADQAAQLEATRLAAVGMMEMAGRLQERIESLTSEENLSERRQSKFRRWFWRLIAGQPQQFEAEGESWPDGWVMWTFRPVPLPPNAEQLSVSPWCSTAPLLLV